MGRGCVGGWSQDELRPARSPPPIRPTLEELELQRALEQRARQRARGNGAPVVPPRDRGRGDDETTATAGGRVEASSRLPSGEARRVSALAAQPRFRPVSDGQTGEEEAPASRSAHLSLIHI